MKRHRNPILNGVTSRVRQLLERYEESKAIQHDTTKGSLREAYLRQFLADFVPHPFEMKSGFVTDCRGDDISPQIDLLVFDMASIPSFALGEYVVVVPLEAVRLCIEVKSHLKSSDFSQINRQQDAVRRMRFAWTSSDRKYLQTVDCLGIPQIVFAFESECSNETLSTWFENEPTLLAICVVGKYCLMRDPNNNKIQSLNADAEHAEVLHLVSRFHSAILDSHREQAERQGVNTADGKVNLQPDLGAYLTFDVPYPNAD